MSVLSDKLASGAALNPLEAFMLTEAVAILPVLWNAVKDDTIPIHIPVHVHIFGIPINVDVDRDIPISSVGGIEARLVAYLEAKLGAATVTPLVPSTTATAPVPEAPGPGNPNTPDAGPPNRPSTPPPVRQLPVRPVTPTLDAYIRADGNDPTINSVVSGTVASINAKRQEAIGVGGMTQEIKDGVASVAQSELDAWMAYEATLAKVGGGAAPGTV